MLIKKTDREIADLLQGTLVGHHPGELTGVASLQEATETDVGFLGNDKYRDQVLTSRAGVVLVPRDYDAPPPEGRAWIVCASPSDDFSRVVPLFTPEPVRYAPGIHPAAVVAEDAVLGAGVHVGPGVVIAPGARIGSGTVLLAGVYIGHRTVVGEGCLLYPHVVVRERCVLGDRVILHPGVVIGADGFGYRSGEGGHEKIPQVGIVELEDDVEIGANSCVDRARFGRTWIRRGTKIDNLVQIGHNVEIGRHGMIVAQVGIAGSARLGDGVVVAGQAGVSGHLKVGDRAIVMAQSGVTKDLRPGAVVFGMPAMDRLAYARQQMHVNRLERTTATVRRLEKELEELRSRLPSPEPERTEP